MNISRWIYFPLIYTIIYVSWMLIGYFILGIPVDSFLGLFWLVWGAVTAFAILFFSNREARKLSDGKDERVFDVRQKRNLVLLANYDESFRMCRDAVLALRSGKIVSEDFQSREITGTNRLKKWIGNKNRIQIRLNPLNDNLTEIEINVRPALRTVLVSDGQSWKTAEEICAYLKEKDAERNKKILADSVSIMEDVYVKPFRKEKNEAPTKQ